MTTVLATETAIPRMMPAVQLQPIRCKMSASAPVEMALWISAPGITTRHIAIISLFFGPGRTVSDSQPG